LEVDVRISGGRRRADGVVTVTVTGAPKNNPSGEKRTALVGCSWPWESLTSVSGVIVTVVTNGAAPAGTDSVHRTPEASVTLSVDAILGPIRALAARPASAVPISWPSPKAASGGTLGTGPVGVLGERVPVVDDVLGERVPVVDGVLAERVPVVDGVPQAAHSSAQVRAARIERRMRG